MKKSFIVFCGLALNAAPVFAQAGDSVLTCTGTSGLGTLTLTLTYSGQVPSTGGTVQATSADYQLEQDTKICGGVSCSDQDDYSRERRELLSLNISPASLGTVYSGTYKEQRMGYNGAGVFNLTLTTYRDPDIRSKVVVTHSYYSEANGNVTETVLSVANLSCSSKTQSIPN